ncbi:tau 95 subunit of transcription factor TFIIIC [Aspergillus wentii]|nr:tau 95 subunit of transcription factor TFIIIC [Aspergillus wentii]
MEQRPTRTAPFYPIPSRHVVSVEHPAIIQNVDKAIDTLQGNAGIASIMNPPKADTPANLIIRPEDIMSRPLQSTSSHSNNILLKVTVPRRTGRKRKKGSNEPFADDSTVPENQPQSAKDLLRSLRDNLGRYQVEPVGMVNRTHVFRGMPDFVFSTSGSEFTNRFRDQILSFDYQKMKQFDLDMSKGAISNVDIIPPPSFSHGDVPFGYFYRQNPTVRQSMDTSGNITTVNTQRAAKILTHLVPGDIHIVPSKPRDNCPPIDTLDQHLQDTIAVVEALFESRPAWTRRGLRNSLTTLEHRTALRHALPYVGYVFRSGPWRDAIVKFGHDPRTSPAYRGYQTLMFRLLPREPELARDGGSGRRHTLPRLPEAEPIDPTFTSATSTAVVPGDSHLFTGQLPLPRDGRMWMFCDITDPLLHSLLFPESDSSSSTTTTPSHLRSTCDTVTDGWYQNGTIAKVKTIMRAKIQSLSDGRMPDDAEYARILAFPDQARFEDFLADFWVEADSGATPRELQLATEVRAMIKNAPEWKARINAAGMDKEGTGTSQEKAAGAAASTGKRVQWRDEVESEGEEEAIEQAEMLEAEAAAAAAAVDARENENENQNEENDQDDQDDQDEQDDLDEDGDVDMDEGSVSRH